MSEHKLRWAHERIAHLGDAQGQEAIDLARWALGKELGMVTQDRIDRRFEATFSAPASRSF